MSTVEIYLTTILIAFPFGIVVGLWFCDRYIVQPMVDQHAAYRERQWKVTNERVRVIRDVRAQHLGTPYIDNDRHSRKAPAPLEVVQ